VNKCIESCFLVPTPEHLVVIGAGYSSLVLVWVTTSCLYLKSGKDGVGSCDAWLLNDIVLVSLKLSLF
jgi:hypothetical protein